MLTEPASSDRRMRVFFRTLIGNVSHQKKRMRGGFLRKFFIHALCHRLYKLQITLYRTF